MTTGGAGLKKALVPTLGTHGGPRGISGPDGLSETGVGWCGEALRAELSGVVWALAGRAFDPAAPSPQISPPLTTKPPGVEAQCAVDLQEAHQQRPNRRFDGGRL